MSTDRLLTITETCRVLGISCTTVYELFRRGQLTSITVSQHARRIPESAVKRYIAECVDRARRIRGLDTTGNGTVDGFSGLACSRVIERGVDMGAFAKRLHEELARQRGGEDGESATERTRAGDRARPSRVFVSYAHRDHVTAANLCYLLADGYSHQVAMRPASGIDVVGLGAVGSSVMPGLETTPTWRSWWQRWASVAGLTVLGLLVCAAAAALVPLASRRSDLVAGLSLALALLSFALPPVMKALWRRMRGQP